MSLKFYHGKEDVQWEWPGAQDMQLTLTNVETRSLSQNEVSEDTRFTRECVCTPVCGVCGHTHGKGSFKVLMSQWTQIS